MNWFRAFQFCVGFFPALFSGDGLSRYHTDFHEIKVSRRQKHICLVSASFC